MGASSPTDVDLQRRVRRQEVVTELSQQALATADLEQLFSDATAAIAETIGADYCGVFELLPEGDEGVLEQGVGWGSDRVGSASVRMNRDSQPGYSLYAAEPIVVDDLTADERVAGSALLREHDVSSAVGVRIYPNDVDADGDGPWGVVGAYATDRRAFTDADADFVERVAGVLESAVENRRSKRELEAVYDRISDGFYAIGEEWQFSYLNDHAHELINPDGRELVGENVWEAFPEALDRDFKPKYECAMYEQEPVSFEEYYPEPLAAWFEVRAYPSETGLSVYFRDITERKEREHELERQTRRFEAIFEDPNILVGLLERDGTVLDINGTAMEYIDADLDAVIGEPFWETPWWGEGADADGERAAADDRDRREIAGNKSDVREWTERAATGEYVEFEADLTRPDGNRYTLNGVFRPVTNDDGDVVSIIVSDRDVTARKERERQLEESEQRYRTLVEHFPNGAVALVDEDLCYRTVGGNPMDVADVTAAQAEGKPVREALPSVLADALVPRYEDALDGEAGSFEIELDGGIFRFQVVPVRDEDGDVFAALGMSQNITEQKERERDLQQYERILETIDDGVYVLDGDSRFRTVNEAFTNVLGRDRDEIVGEHASTVFTAEKVDRAERLQREMVEGGADIAELEEHVKAADGEVPVVTRFSLFETDGELGRVGVVRDVTARKDRERQLEESEQRYRALAEYFPNGLVTLFDRDLRYELAAGQGFDRIPVEPEDLEGKLVSEVWPDETVAELGPAFEAALNGEERSIELEYADREWVIHAVPITDERGAVFAGMTMAQDITEQKERERYLEDAKSRLEAATEAGAVGTWEWDIQTDEMVVGPSFARTFGIDPGAAREGVSLDRFIAAIHQDDRARVEAEIEDAIETCGEYESEYRVWNADGELRWVVARGRVECDGDGTAVRFPGALTDITERKRAELRLQRTNEQLETLFEVLPVGVVVADADGRLIQANDTAREIWGGDVFDAESIAEYERYPVRWADSGEPVPPEEMTLARVLDGEEVQDPDILEFETYDGDRRIVRLEGMPVRNERGEVTRGVVTMTDITERREFQRRLAESERRYRTLIEHFPNGAVALFDEDLQYQIVGGSAFDEIEDTAGDIVGKTLWERYHPELSERMEPKLRAALEGETNAFELAFHDRDWMAYTVPVIDDDGEIFGGMVMVQNITERKERERELRERERRLEQYKEYTDAILDAIDDVFYVIGEDGTLQRWNQSLAEVTEYTNAELAGMSPTDFFEGDDVAATTEVVREGFESGSANVEVELATKDGDTIPFEFAASTLEDPWGNTVLAGIGRDITERLERQRALEESERRYRTLTQHFPNGAVGVYDHTLAFTLAEGAELGESLPPADRIEGSRLSELFPEGVVTDLEPLCRTAIEDGEIGNVEITFDGRTWRVWATPLRDADGDIFAGLSFAQDVTERREYQRKLEQSNERLEQFAYAASHDLQEPLRMVSSYLQLIDRRYGDDLDADGEEFLEFAVDGAERMREMIDGLLEYSRVETRGDPFEPVDLNDVLEEVLEDLQLRIEENDAEITTEELPRVEGDASQLRQVFQNLLSNAITYSGAESPRVRVGAERRGNRWVLSVADEGIGIDPEDQDRVFTIFDRLHNREEYEGTGIGLALCERIVERHGGDIWVESEPGEGSTFSFALPADRSREQ
ncbi:PAS domain-containing protein [Natrinema salifodinae]|uniref:histidine kinase n=1 Tax=Natrinema salifodinae TaxID=1202768 RepID=A0A1I0Q8T4_9EURY|nr:PAS domain-containing protein [Natrinema salifodinae]SEW23415.1 PAS domain S-box-containing protein [Natrinema salifodinae]